MLLDYSAPKKWWLPPKFEVFQATLVLQGVNIPLGFKTDGASVPRILPVIGLLLIALGHFWPTLYWPGVVLVLSLALFPRCGQSFRAAVLHDYILQTQPRKWRWANRLFYRQLRADGVPKWRAIIMLLAVTAWQFLNHAVLKRLLKRT